ncbi:MAG: methyltransferase domain-containing protein [Gemmatimonadota bacterium]|nr:methyltransferase domain-containing protein [Gemmatimonadota bacterium]
MSEWFTRWFGREYLDLYPHRDEREARAVVRMIRNIAPPQPGGMALDLACGSGRHTRSLCNHIWTAGLDLSMEMLQVAHSESSRIPYVRGDMRALPFAPDAFELVVNLFTSFGYFSSDDENRVVLAEVSRVLRHGGVFVLDYLNADHVRETLVPHDSRRVGERMVTQSRRISDDGRYVEKEISATGLDRPVVERVRLFEPDDLRCLLHDAGFSIGRELGDYAAGPLTRTSPRAIFFAYRS